MKETLNIIRHPDGTYSSFWFKEENNSPPKRSPHNLHIDELRKKVAGAPLPFQIDSSPEIIGYGPHSFAIRLNPDKVAVIRPSPSKEHSDPNLRLSKLTKPSSQLAILGNKEVLTQLNQILKESIETGKRKIFPDFAGRLF